MGRLLPHAPRALRPSAPWNASRLLAERAQQDPGGTGLLYLDRRISWGELDRAVDRTARALQEAGIGPGDVVALLMDNRPEFLLAVTALSRLRAVAALVNTNATGRALEHAISAVSPKLALVGTEHAAALLAVLPALPQLSPAALLCWRDDSLAVPPELADFEARLEAAGGAPVDVGAPRADECMCYIY